jgi:hypothetical protein
MSSRKDCGLSLLVNVLLILIVIEKKLYLFSRSNIPEKVLQKYFFARQHLTFSTTRASNLSQDELSECNDIPLVGSKTFRAFH